ncbi:hypothetical protein Gorai_007856 [Gossypium raimondii]|uniref:Uncharacterized protein n=1 Tax=Gossypium raimondii TaxID=29730 RepID=A0A7J8Q972_GOSRA|nr:hypothetical protein [Gossypium raimondii]
MFQVLHLHQTQDFHHYLLNLLVSIMVMRQQLTFLLIQLQEDHVIRI